MNKREWIVQYHGNLGKALRGINIGIDIINEKYAIINCARRNIPYLKQIIEIEKIEESSQLNQVVQIIHEEQMKSPQKWGLTGKGGMVGWIRQVADQSSGGLSAMDMCIGKEGIAPASEPVVVNWQKNKFYTADALRALRFIIGKLPNCHKPLIIYFPFDISEKTGKTFIREIISDMSLRGKIMVVSSLARGHEDLEANLGLSMAPLFSSCSPLTVGTLALLMEWGSVRGHDPSLYGQKLRTYYIKNTFCLWEKNNPYTRSCSLNNLGELLRLLAPPPVMEEFRTLDVAYEFAPADGIIDVFIKYNSFDLDSTIVTPQDTSLYPLVFPYLGVRGTVREIKQLIKDYLGKLATGSLAYVLGSPPIEMSPWDFKAVSILEKPVPLKGKGTLIGIIDTGIDYTNPVFINDQGESRIQSIWDQTVGMSSPYGYGSIYDQAVINQALKSPDPFALIPHKDEWGSGTMLAGIAAGYGEYKGEVYEGVAPEAEIVVVKLATATPIMQDIYHSERNPLAFSALDIARAIQYFASLADQHQKPISICLPQGSNIGPHDGTSVLDSVTMIYAENPGVSVVLPAGEEANKGHHAMGDFREQSQKEFKLKIPKGQGGFIVEIWADFGDRLEASITTPRVGSAEVSEIFLNRAQTYRLLGSSYVWSQGSKIDRDTGCQVIRFRLGDPMAGEWTITVKGILVIEGHYHIWIPKTGMILPETVLSPANPFTTIYNTSSATGLMTVACYDRKSQAPTPSSGRGFTRDHQVKPDFMVPGVNIPGPLPGNKWGMMTGTAVASAITVGITSLVYEDQITLNIEPSNTVGMKAILVEQLKREATIDYPSPSRGYGLLGSEVYDESL